MTFSYDDTTIEIDWTLNITHQSSLVFELDCTLVCRCYEYDDTMYWDIATIESPYGAVIKPTRPPTPLYNVLLEAIRKDEKLIEQKLHEIYYNIIPASDSLPMPVSPPVDEVLTATADAGLMTTRDYIQHREPRK